LLLFFLTRKFLFEGQAAVAVDAYTKFARVQMIASKEARPIALILLGFLVFIARRLEEVHNAHGTVPAILQSGVLARPLLILFFCFLFFCFCAVEFLIFDVLLLFALLFCVKDETTLQIAVPNSWQPS